MGVGGEEWSSSEAGREWWWCCCGDRQRPRLHVQAGRQIDRQAGAMSDDRRRERGRLYYQPLLRRLLVFRGSHESASDNDDCSHWLVWLVGLVG